ncbi:MAG: radical SAM protein, partial [Candidatus Izemoplasma sp.]
MKDNYQRNIDYIRISVTDRCNLRCLYCMPDGTDLKTHDEIIRDEEIIDTVRSGVELGITKVRITGGEPLVRRGIYELIKKISLIKEINEITITTNGLLLIGNVKKLKDAGINRVNFSLDTLDNEKFKFITNTDQILDYEALIEELIEFDLQPIKINT